MQNYRFNIIVWKEGKYYVTQCLNTNVSSFGDTKEEALKNTHEALELYFEDEKSKDTKYVSVEQAEVISSSLSYA
jgi:predicted RNase H-like HicB family nuclease